VEVEQKRWIGSMLQRPRAWASLTLAFETHSIVEGEAVSTLLSCFTIDAIQNHTGLGGPEY
jgi:hypothetical protein